ncbi:hypothetical protein ACFE04_029472 [Oxalis oulophora]
MRYQRVVTPDTCNPLPNTNNTNNNNNHVAVGGGGGGGGGGGSGGDVNLDERSPAGNGSPSRNTSVAASRAISRSAAANKRSPTPEKVDKKSPKKDEKLNGSLADNNVTRFDSASGQSEKEVKAVVGGGQKVHQEWPRIYVNLSKKEKEEDFMAMRGTKLPHRPKKRPKNVDRALQYCFPGMWLPDVTKSRYEVREKKCVKKKYQV